MIRFDHVALPVRDHVRSRDWYTANFGFRVEFEVPERRTVALRDDGDMTLFLVGSADARPTPSCALTFQVDDVHAKCRELGARGVDVAKPPQKLFWGYGAELVDPDGYRLHLWDERSMREKGGA